LKALLFIIVPTLIFVGVLLLIAAADKIVDRFVGSRSGRRRRNRSFARRIKPNRCIWCGNAFSDDLLLNGICIFCREKAEAARLREEMKTGWKGEESLMAQYYSLLGCTQTDSNKTIRRRYHEIVKQIHPDMLFQQDLPDWIIKANTEEFHRIQEAYDKIMENRKRPA